MILELRIEVISEGRVYTGKVQEGNFWGAGNGMYLDLDVGYKGIYTYKSSSSCTLKIEPFIHFMYAVSQLKSRREKLFGGYFSSIHPNLNVHVIIPRNPISSILS